MDTDPFARFKNRYNAVANELGVLALVVTIGAGALAAQPIELEIVTPVDGNNHDR